MTLQPAVGESATELGKSHPAFLLSEVNYLAEKGEAGVHVAPSHGPILKLML
jgi:hypothetical protein